MSEIFEWMDGDAAYAYLQTTCLHAGCEPPAVLAHAQLRAEPAEQVRAVRQKLQRPGVAAHGALELLGEPEPGRTRGEHVRGPSNGAFRPLRSTEEEQATPRVIMLLVMLLPPPGRFGKKQEARSKHKSSV